MPRTSTGWPHRPATTAFERNAVAPLLDHFFAQRGGHFGFNKSGATALQRMFRDSSAATDLVKPMMPAFDAA